MVCRLTLLAAALASLSACARPGGGGDPAAFQRSLYNAAAIYQMTRPQPVYSPFMASPTHCNTINYGGGFGAMNCF